MGINSDKSESSHLRFQSSEDAINHAKQVTKDAKDWIAAHNVHLVERYIKGELRIVVLNDCAGFGDRKYDLLLSNVPPRGHESYRTGNTIEGTDVHSTRHHPDGGKHPMLICSAYPVECPNEVVPSFVWLESPQERKNILMEIFGPFLPEHTLEHNFKFAEAIGDGKIGFPGDLNRTRSNCNSMPCLIQGGSEIVNRIRGNNCKFIRERLGEFDLVNLINSIRIGLSDSGVWPCIEKNIDLLFKIKDVFLCSADTEL